MTRQRFGYVYLALVVLHLFWRYYLLSAAVLLSAIFLVTWMVDDWRAARRTRR